MPWFIVYILLKGMIDASGGDISTLEKAVSDLQKAVAAIGAGLNYKGTVAKVINLPNDASKGDCYTVTEKDNQEYVFDGQNWIPFGADLTPISDTQIKSLLQ